MNISSVGAVGTSYQVSSAGKSPAQAINELKTQKKALEERLKNGESEVQGKINSIDEQIHRLETRMDKITGKEKCQTCEERRYQDGSDDPGVSFKTASKISPENAASAVRGHEYEHVVRERAKAEREDREVVSQTVTLKSAVCPECGKPYVSGGETVTTTKSKPENPYAVGIPNENENTGDKLNTCI